MLVTNVLRTQSGRVWLRQNVGIVGTPCVVHRPRLAPTSLLPPARATLPSSSPGCGCVPIPHNPSPAFTGRYFMTSPGKPLHTRRGEGWVVQGGDACVALVPFPCAPFPSCQGDASVPTPLHTTPAPTNGTICPPKSLPLKVHNPTQEIFRFLVNPGEKMN